MGYESIFGTKSSKEAKKRYSKFKAEIKAIDHKDKNFDSVLSKIENIIGVNGCTFTEDGKFVNNQERMHFTDQSFFIFADPRFLSGSKSESSASFYKLNSKPEGFFAEKIDFKDVLDLYGVKKPQKPKLGFFGTIRNFFKKYDSMKKYDRELEVYNAKKDSVLNNKLGFKGIKYNENLVDEKVAEKYINEGVVDTSLKKPEAQKKAAPNMSQNITRAAEDLYNALEKNGLALDGGVGMFRLRVSDCFCHKDFADSREGAWLQDFIMKGKNSIVDGKIPDNKAKYFIDFCKKFDEGTKKVIGDFWKVAPDVIKPQMEKENANLNKENNNAADNQKAKKKISGKYYVPDMKLEAAARVVKNQIYKHVSEEDQRFFPMNVGDVSMNADFIESEEGEWMKKFLLDGQELADDHKFSGEKEDLYSDFCVKFNAVMKGVDLVGNGQRAQAMIKDFRAAHKEMLAEPQAPLIGGPQ